MSIQIHQLDSSTQLELLEGTYVPVVVSLVNESLVTRSVDANRLAQAIPSGVAPESPNTGLLWFNTAANRLQLWNGSDWVNVGITTLSELEGGGNDPNKVVYSDGQGGFRLVDKDDGFFDGSWSSVNIDVFIPSDLSEMTNNNNVYFSGVVTELTGAGNNTNTFLFSDGNGGVEMREVIGFDGTLASLTGGGNESGKLVKTDGSGRLVVSDDGLGVSLDDITGAGDDDTLFVKSDGNGGLQTAVLQPNSTESGDYQIYDAANDGGITPRQHLFKAYIGRSDPEVLFNRDITITFTDILNNFIRVKTIESSDATASGYEDDTAATRGTSATRWVIDANGELSQDTNTTYAILLKSDVPYEGYQCRVICRSADTDEDMIGFIVAFNETNDNSLTVVRTRMVQTGVHGALYRWGLAYNFGLQGERWHPGSVTTVQGDWSDDDNAFTWGVDAAGWGSVFPNGTPIKIDKQRDSVDVWLASNATTCPEWTNNGPGGWVGRLSVDLTDNNVTTWLDRSQPGVAGGNLDMTQFQTSIRWGLIARSQELCSWTDLNFSARNAGSPFQTGGTQDLVFDLTGNSVWQYNAVTRQWDEETDRNIHDFLFNGQSAFDLGHNTFFHKNGDQLFDLLSRRRQGRMMQADFTLGPDDYDCVIRCLAGVSTITVPTTLPAGLVCRIINYTGGDIDITTTGNPGARTVTIATGENAKIIATGNFNNSDVAVLIMNRAT